jgi:hypothetical protein
VKDTLKRESTVLTVGGGEPHEGRLGEIRAIAERVKTLEGESPRRATR